MQEAPPKVAVHVIKKNIPPKDVLQIDKKDLIIKKEERMLKKLFQILMYYMLTTKLMRDGMNFYAI